MNMKTIGKGLAILLALFVLFNAFGYIFNLDALSESSAILGEGNWGRANIRANIGGPLIFLAIIYAFGVFANRTQFIHVGIFFFASVILGRVLSMVLDGFDSSNMRGIVFAGVLLIINVAAYLLIERGEKAAEA